MAQFLDNGRKTFISAGTFAQYARVKQDSSGTIIVATLTDVGIGIALNASLASGDAVAVKLWNSPGTFPMIAKEALAINATLYTEADGKVQDTAEATSLPFALAHEAATAENDIIECGLLPYRGTAAS